MKTNLAAQIDMILPRVSKPARYTGNEWNSVVKDWETTPVKVALAYPDIYEVGICNLGLEILYDILNRQPDVLAERVYAPWTDMEAELRAAPIPLYSLETYHPLAEFDIIGFTLPFELTYTNILNMLDLAHIPLFAAARAAPLVIGGGSGAYNPEPLADFFDAFVLGDGEEVILELINAYRENRAASRETILRTWAQIAGVYVPRFYDVTYDADSRVIQSITPNDPQIPAQVTRRVVKKLPPPPPRPIVPYIQAVHDRATIELQRGCTRGCRFCQAGMIYRPVRERPLAEILASADAILAATGYEEIGLLSLSSADYTCIEAAVRELLARYAERHVSISLPSLRIDTFSVELARMIQTQRKTGFTFAPEAGSQRLRDVINKDVTEDDLWRTAEAVYSSGWDRVKLYFMIGLPTETMEDIDAIAELVRGVFAIGKKHRGGRARVNVSISNFVPKPQTPFQWHPLDSADNLNAKQVRLCEQLRDRRINLSWNEPATSLLEAMLARGDRRLGAVIHRAWQLGAKFDTSTEHFAWDRWAQALAEHNLSADWYARRVIPLAEPLPWAHLSSGVRRVYLEEEYKRSLEAVPRGDCRENCFNCGIRAAFELAECPATA